MTSVCVFGRILGKIAPTLNQIMQRDTDTTFNLIARERPCQTLYLAEGKKDKRPPTVLMKPLMYTWYAFRRCTLKGGNTWKGAFANVLVNDVVECPFAAIPKPSGSSNKVCPPVHPATPTAQQIQNVINGGRVQRAR